MENRFRKIRELGSKGKRSNPLLLEEFQWENEWVNDNCEVAQEGGGSGNDITWAQVDEAVGATQSLQGRGLPRAAAARVVGQTTQTYVRHRKRARNTVTQDIEEDDDELQEDNAELDSATVVEEDEGSAPGGGGGDEDGHGGFDLVNDLLD
jgi:hypothetical protein